MAGPILIPWWAVILGPPTFVGIMVANALTGGRVIRALEDYHAGQIDRQFGWDRAPPGSPENRRQIAEMLERDYQAAKCTARKPSASKHRKRRKRGRKKVAA